jgi:hypothetical protein
VDKLESIEELEKIAQLSGFIKALEISNELFDFVVSMKDKNNDRIVIKLMEEIEDKKEPMKTMVVGKTIVFEYEELIHSQDQTGLVLSKLKQANIELFNMKIDIIRNKLKI